MIPIVWAEQTTSASLIYHSSRGSSTITISQSGSVVFVGSTNDKAPDYLVHGLIMWISWSIFAFVQIGSVRWFGEYWKYNQLLHSISG
jgi:hypothetical protein